VEYITGQCRFRNVDLLVDRRVTVPQPEFGPLVDVALRLARGSRVHDVGTGSGAIALAIKSERADLTVSGSDVSPEAISVARANAARLGLDVTFRVARGLPPGEYALVTANLPFQDETSKTLDVPPEFTEYQPYVAMFGGTEGLGVIRGFLREVPGGITVAISCQPSQAVAVRSLFRNPEELTSAKPDEIVFTVGQVA
jgi:release factor glutamine methyltransferase